MNKKLFLITTIIFSVIFFVIFYTFSNYSNTNYKEEVVNGFNVKGDTTKYQVSLVKKIDGDTIVVNFNNKELTIRYLLIDTPETVKANTDVQKYGPEASALNEKLLKEAKKIEIEFDVYQKKDKYGRALCYVYADDILIQEELILNGLAKIKYVKEPDTRYLAKLKRAENIAKSNKRNLWEN